MSIRGQGEGERWQLGFWANGRHSDGMIQDSSRWISKCILKHAKREDGADESEHINAQSCSHVLHKEHAYCCHDEQSSYLIFSPLFKTWNIQQIFLNRQLEVK